jgi:putative redox protein
MKQHITNTKHINNLAFDAEIDGHTIRFDDSKGNSGPRPKAILLNSLAICSGFDVVEILKKMKVEFSDLEIVTTGDLSEEQPQIYTHIHMEFKLKTDHTNRAKVERAVQLSVEKYCGVYAMLIKVCQITTGINLL